jgi:hypothetical protein
MYLEKSFISNFNYAYIIILNQIQIVILFKYSYIVIINQIQIVIHIHTFQFKSNIPIQI